MFVGSTRISELCMCVYMGFIHYWRRCGINVTVGKFSWRARPVVDCAVPPTPHRYLLRKKEKYVTRKTCAAVAIVILHVSDVQLLSSLSFPPLPTAAKNAYFSPSSIGATKANKDIFLQSTGGSNIHLALISTQLTAPHRRHLTSCTPGIVNKTVQNSSPCYRFGTLIPPGS